MATPVYGQTSNFKNDTLIIKGLDSNYIRKTKAITLLTTDSFIFVASYKIFITHLKKRIKEDDTPGDKLLLNEYEQTFAEVYEDGAKVSKTPELIRESLEAQIINLVNGGQCLIFNKNTKWLEKKLISIKYVDKGYISRNRIENINHQIIIDIITGFY
jgi:hypothetical protein